MVALPGAEGCAPSGASPVEAPRYAGVGSPASRECDVYVNKSGGTPDLLGDSLQRSPDARCSSDEFLSLRRSTVPNEIPARRTKVTSDETRAADRHQEGPLDRSLRREAPGVDHRGSALPDDGDLLLPGRHPWRPTAPARRGVPELDRPPGVQLRRPRPDLAGAPHRLPGGDGRLGGARLAAGPRARARRGVRRHRAGRGLQVHRRRCHLRPRAGALGPPAPRGVGCRLRRPGLPHRAPAPRRQRVGDRRPLDGRGLPDHRRRRVVGAAQPRDPGRVPPRGPAVPRVRPVRAQGGPAPVEPDAALRPEPRWRLPLRRRGGDLGLDRRGSSVRLRLPDRRTPSRARHHLRLPDRRRRLALPTGGPPAGLALEGRRRAAGSRSTRDCPRRSTRR